MDVQERILIGQAINNTHAILNASIAAGKWQPDAEAYNTEFRARFKGVLLAELAAQRAGAEILAAAYSPQETQVKRQNGVTLQ